MFENFDLEGCKILKGAEQERTILNHPYVGTEHLMLSALKRDSKIANLFQVYHVTYENFRKELIQINGHFNRKRQPNLYTPLLKRIINNALINSQEKGKKVIKTGDLIKSLVEEGEGIAFRILMILKVDLNQLTQTLNEFQNPNELYLNEIGINLNQTVALDEKVINREKEIHYMMEILWRKKKSNPLLVGVTGVGKTAIVEELARRIKLKQCPEFLENKQIIMLEMGALVAGTKYRGEFEEKLTRLVNEIVKTENVILFIDEIHTMVNAGGAEGAINAADILKPYLARGCLKCIGATTPMEYEKIIAKDTALDRRFEKILITEPSDTELYQILQGIKSEYETFHHLKITPKNLTDIIKYGNEFLTNRHNPDKAIDLLDTVCAYVKLKTPISESGSPKMILAQLKELKEQAVCRHEFQAAIDFKMQEIKLENKLQERTNYSRITKADIIAVLNLKTNTPTKKEKIEHLNQLESLLKANLFKQREAVTKIIRTLKTFPAPGENKPLILNLIGPPGVGKSTAVNIIKNYYNKKYPVIDIDVNRFRSEEIQTGLIGSFLRGAEGEIPYLLKPLRNDCFSLIIIENYDQGTTQLKTIINPLLEKGKLANWQGQILGGPPSWFILTSTLNQGQSIGFVKTKTQVPDLKSGLVQDIYFQPFDENDVRQYLRLKGITNPKQITKILQDSEYQSLGLKKIENLIAKENILTI